MSSSKECARSNKKNANVEKHANTTGNISMTVDDSGRKMEILEGLLRDFLKKWERRARRWKKWWDF